MIADSVEQPIRHRAATEFENMGLVSFVDIHGRKGKGVIADPQARANMEGVIKPEVMKS